MSSNNPSTYDSMTIPALVYLLGNRRMVALPDTIKETAAIEGALIRAIAAEVSKHQPGYVSEHSPTVAEPQQIVTNVTPEEKA